MDKITSILQYHSPSLAHKRMLWGYYTSDREFIPIYSRPPVSPLKSKTETLIHTDFFSDVVNLKTGYLYSKIGLTSQSPEIQGVLDNLERVNSISSLNVESGKHITSEGVSFRLMYNDKGVLKAKNLPSWQIVMDYADDIYESDMAYYFHSSTDVTGKVSQYCDIYDNQSVSYWEKVSVKGKEVWNPRLVAADGSNQELHLFQSLPIIPFVNNAEMFGNCNASIDTSDAFDNMHSDVVSEIRASRLAYLKIWGELNTNVATTNSNGETSVVAIEPSEWLKQFGTMVFGTDDQGNKFGDAQFLEKKMDDAAIEHNLDRLRQHFFEESKSIDLKQLTDTANARVFTVKASLMRFDIDSSNTEVYLRKSLVKMLNLVSEYEVLSGRSGFDPLVDCTITVSRNFPIDIDASANALQKLLAVLPARKAYALSDLVEASEVEALADEWESGELDVTGVMPQTIDAPDLPVVRSVVSMEQNE